MLTRSDQISSSLFFPHATRTPCSDVRQRELPVSKKFPVFVSRSVLF